MLLVMLLTLSPENKPRVDVIRYRHKISARTNRPLGRTALVIEIKVAIGLGEGNGKLITKGSGVWVGCG